MSAAPERADFDLIASWVQPGERVLDLGCGDGSLLKRLIEERGARGYGVELEDAEVLAAIGNGINVIQGNLEQGLAGFDDGTFNHVVLSRTLQTVRHTERILSEMLRVGREAVVSFPNFAYWKNRMAVMAGRMPVSEDLPYEWFDTPNLRFFTILDFGIIRTLGTGGAGGFAQALFLFLGFLGEISLALFERIVGFCHRGPRSGNGKRKQWRNCTAVLARFSIAAAGSGSRRPARYSS